MFTAPSSTQRRRCRWRWRIRNLGIPKTASFETQQARIALQHEFETDSVRLFAFYEKRASLTLGTASDQARGAEIAWFRSMTPALTGGSIWGMPVISVIKQYRWALR